MLGEHLVHRPDAGEHAGARVRDAEDLEQLLDRPVLAVTSVHGDEGDLGRRITEAVDQIGAGVDRHHLVPKPFEGVLHPGARPKGDLALERAAALENGHPGHRVARRERSEGVGMWTTSAPELES